MPAELLPKVELWQLSEHAIQTLVDRGSRVMQRAEHYATLLGLEVMPGFVDLRTPRRQRVNN